MYFMAFKYFKNTVQMNKYKNKEQKQKKIKYVN